LDNLWVAVILGIVEGITEFLPVSSTGHLIVAGHLLKFTGDKAAAFEIIIQLGAILAVVFLYWDRFIRLIPLSGDTWRREAGLSGLRGLALLGLTTFPALVAGALVHRAVKTYLFSPMTVAWALAVGAVGILLAERFKPQAQMDSVDELTFGRALVIGLFQCLSLWPGMSRSASTIIGGLLCGLNRPAAAEYSFLAAVPVMIAATAYELYKDLHAFQGTDFLFLAVGFVVSFVSAALAVKVFISLVQRWSLAPFAWYRLAIAPVIYFMMS
jgi:undecaprenyl-diphosphatase